MPGLTAVDYYRDPAVRARILEFCGASAATPPTCAYITSLCPGPLTRWETAEHFASTNLDRAFASGCDLGRSMRDSGSLVVHLDVDYFENTLAGDALLRPGHAFLRLEPVFRTIRFELARLEMPLLSVMTGRGYQFTGRIPLAAGVVDRLADLGRPGASRPANAAADRDDTRRDRAFVGMGMVLESLAHTVMRRAAASSDVPLVMNGTEVGKGGIGRESVSIDLSYCGDSLDARHVRVAFGMYQNHLLRPDIFGDTTAALVPTLAVVPRGDRPLIWMLEHARRLDQARDLAARESTALPDATRGMERLLDEYLRSPLSEIHADFYSVAPLAPDARPDIYDTIDVRALPACVAWPLVNPNDALLKPTIVQHLTRALLSRGWHPRHIAGLVASKFARERYGWGDRWTRMDPARRADYDVRVFFTLLAAGVDEAIDFNCVSAQEKRLCPRGICGHDLRDDRTWLLQRIVR
jgi:hypothetical protein